MFENNSQRILEIIRVIKTNIGYINQVNISTIKKDEDNIKDYYFVSMALFTILNKLIDLGEQSVEQLNLDKYPTKYIEFFEILLSEKIIPKELFNKIKIFIEYRNDIAHEYSEIHENEIKWCVQNLNYIEEFLKIIKGKILKNL